MYPAVMNPLSAGVCTNVGRFFENAPVPACSAKCAGELGAKSVLAICGCDQLCVYGDAGPFEAMVEVEGVRW